MITRIKPPKFRVGKYVLNEYELRCLLAELTEDKHQEFIGKKVTEITNENKPSSIIQKGYIQDGALHGLSINTQFAFKALAFKNKSRIFKNQ